MASLPPRKLTKQFVESFERPGQGYVMVRDEGTPGFGVKFSKSCASYFVERRVRGKTRRVMVGRHGTITLHEARRQAHAIYGELSKGVDVIRERRKKEEEARQQAENEAVQNTTLGQAYAEFIKTRTLKPKTRRDYERAVLVTLGGWEGLPLTELTKDMVLERYAKLADKPASANLTMRALRAVLNYAMEVYTLPGGEYLLARNPVTVLSKTKAWKEVAPRINALKPHELKAWFRAVGQERNSVARDYLIFVLLTGLRRENAASLTWAQVDFEDRSFTIIPKAHNELTLPLSDYLLDMLRERREKTASLFVFPSTGKKGYLQEPRKALERIADRTGIKSTTHDLRRSFAKFAATLELPDRVIKQLMAHTARGDVTEDYYTQRDVERLRRPAQAITDYVLMKAEVKVNMNVTSIKAARTIIAAH